MHAPIPGRGGQHGAVRRKVTAQNPPKMLPKRLDPRACRDVPETREIVSAAWAHQ